MVLDKYPDILLELKENYGIGWSTKGETFEKGQFYKIQSGSHQRYSPVCLISNLNNRYVEKGNVTLMDLAPTILDILTNNSQLNLDGTSILNQSKINLRIGKTVNEC